MKILTVIKSSWFKQLPQQASALPQHAKLAVAAGSSFAVKYAFQVGKHCFVELETPLAPIGRFGYFFIDHVTIAIDEIRGVWLTTTDSKVLLEASKLRPALEQLRALNFNTLYPVVWTGGYTLYPSQVAEKTFGQALHPIMHARGGDLLAEMIELGHGMGFRVIPWFEYGLMTPPPPTVEPGAPLPTSLAVRKRSWLTEDFRGELIRLKPSGKGGMVPDDCVWLNPCRPDVKAFLVALIAEVVRRYRVDGIQLDDHFGMPKEMGYDSFTKSLFTQQTGRRRIPLKRGGMGWSPWADWRAKHVTELMRQIFKAVKLINPHCRISLSPNPHGFSLREYLADWGLWVQEGLIEELVIQLYRPTLSALNNELKEANLLKARDRIPTAIGLFTGYRSSPWTTSVIREQTHAVRQKSFSGVSYFFYETLVNQQIAADRVIARDRAEFDFFV